MKKLLGFLENSSIIFWIGFHRILCIKYKYGRLLPETRIKSIHSFFTRVQLLKLPIPFRRIDMTNVFVRFGIPFKVCL